MKLSARNVIKGKVLHVTAGAVNSEVTLEVTPGIELVAIVSKESADKLALKPGSVAYAIIKASNIILGAD